MPRRPRQARYGLNPSEEHAKEELVRDIRPLWVRLHDALLERPGFLAAMLAGMGAMLLCPAASPVLLPLLLGLALRRRFACRFDCLPMRVPQVWPGPDFGDVLPQGGFHRARGTFYVGNEIDTGRELWISREDMLTHMLVLGTTGAGKTETLVSLAFNFLAAGSGLLYVDPKAAPKLGAQIYSMCRLVGRDDDFLLLSYMADKKAQASMRSFGHMRTPLRQSNTQNPFAVGTANQLTQILFSLMPAGDDKGGNAIFSSNAQTLISGLMAVLVEMRDRGEVPLSIGVVRRYLLSIPEITRLALREDLSEKSMLSLQAALATVGWEKGLPLDKQPRSFAEQYGYARAYFGRALSLLVDSYGRIFMTSHGEVDAVDVITSRRVYVTLIPSMDKDPKELKSLGQICLSSIRNACAVGLGDVVQGRLADVLGALPTDARTPFGVIVDEYAAIETPGFEILLTQGRGLGIACVVASQDFAGIKRASPEAAEQIVANCKLKLFMCLEDPSQTYELIRSLAGSGFTFEASGWKGEPGSTAYADTLGAKAAMRPRVDFRDLQKQVEGQMTAFFKGEMIRGRTFYACPPLDMHQELRLSYHLKLQAPDPALLSMREGERAALSRACRALARGRVPQPVRLGALPDGLPAAGRAFALFAALPAAGPAGGNERALAALLALPLEAEFQQEVQLKRQQGSAA